MREKGNIIPFVLILTALALLIVYFLLKDGTALPNKQETNVSNSFVSTPKESIIPEASPINERFRFKVPEITAGDYKYETTPKTVRITNEGITFYKDDHYIVVNAEIKRTNLNTKNEETVVKSLSDNLLGSLIAPSGCCAKEFDITNYWIMKTKPYLIVARRNFYLIDLDSKKIAALPTNYSKYFAREIQISSDESLIFLDSYDKHSGNFQEVIDLQNKVIYKLPEFWVGDEVFNEFVGFELNSKVKIALKKTYEEKINQVLAKTEIHQLSEYPHHSFALNFQSQ